MSTRPTVPCGRWCLADALATPCTQTNSAQVQRPSSRPQRQAVWCLPGAWVEAGGVYHASTVAGRPGARAPGRHHTAGRSVQRGRLNRVASIDGRALADAFRVARVVHAPPFFGWASCGRAGGAAQSPARLRHTRQPRLTGTGVPRCGSRARRWSRHARSGSRWVDDLAHGPSGARRPREGIACMSRHANVRACRKLGGVGRERQWRDATLIGRTGRPVSTAT